MAGPDRVRPFPGRLGRRAVRGDGGVVLLPAHGSGRGVGAGGRGDDGERGGDAPAARDPDLDDAAAVGRPAGGGRVPRGAHGVGAGDLRAVRLRDRRVRAAGDGRHEPGAARGAGGHGRGGAAPGGPGGVLGGVRGGVRAPGALAAGDARPAAGVGAAAADRSPAEREGRRRGCACSRSGRGGRGVRPLRGQAGVVGHGVRRLGARARADGARPGGGGGAVAVPLLGGPDGVGADR